LVGGGKAGYQDGSDEYINAEMAKMRELGNWVRFYVD